MIFLPRSFCLAAVGLGLALGLSACSTKRYLRIETTPPGARIWVNGELYPNPTPVVVPFTHYGRFDVRVEKVGYESVARELRVATQLDGYPVVDLPLEMMRRERRFRRVIELTPLPTEYPEKEIEAFVEQVKAFRERARREANEEGTPLRTDP